MFAYISLAIGALGVAFGAWSYHELWKWAKQCKNARIAIAYKGRTALQAPIVEWITWANMLGDDDRSSGRVVYRNQKVTVFITRLAKKTESSTEVRTVKSNAGDGSNG